MLAVASASFHDVLFAVTCGAIGELLVLLARRWPPVASCLRLLFVAFFAICAAYAVAAVGLFKYFNRPLTFELLTLVQNAAMIRSSVAERLSVPVALALLLVPAAFLFLALRASRRRSVRAGGVAAAAVWLAIGVTVRGKQWDERQLQHLRLSPHAELLRTAVMRLSGGARPAFPKNFPPDYMDDFRTFAARGAPAKSSFQSAASEAVRPRNAIIVVLESVGTKYLHLYGYGREITPNLTAESRHALVFDNIYAHASFTYASFRPLNFSVYPGLPWHYALISKQAAPSTLAGKLKERGSRTGYFTSGDLDWGAQRWLLQRRQNFDVLAGSSELGCPVLSSWGTEDRCVVDRLIRWIDEKPGEPFFAVCWTDQTHDPYPLSAGLAPLDFPPGQPQPPFAEDLARYLALVRNVDAQLGRLFAALRERGVADETLVVITGDHGEAFADPHQQRGHAWSVYQEEVHVPLMIWNPRLFPEGRRAGTIGGHVDLNPTLADLLGVDPHPEWQGHSLFDPERPNRAYFMAIAGGDVFGVREGDWKYIYDVTTGRESLFHLRLDPDEQHDFAATEPGVALQLRQRVAAWVSFEDAFLQGRAN